MDKKGIIVVGAGGVSATVERIISELGKDVIVITAEEAKEKGLDAFKPEPLPITALPIVGVASPKKSGKAKRRDRRKQERKNKKRKK